MILDTFHSQSVSSRRNAVPFDPYYFEKLARSGATAPADVIFRDIYRRHHWAGGRSASGAGAAPEQVRQLQIALPPLMQELGVATLLDLPCGDYSWMQTVELPIQSYLGAELLPELVHRLNAAYADSRRRFMMVNLIQDPLPPADLLLCRDCLVHLSYADIQAALANVRRSGIPFFLTTTFPDCQANEDIVTGDWRVLNLERKPFLLPPPLQLLNEGCTEADGVFADKSLGLWRSSDLA